MLSLKFADLVGMTTHVRVSLLLLKRLLLKCQRWQREGCSVHAQRSERVCLDDALAAVSPIERLLPLLSVCLLRFDGIPKLTDPSLIKSKND